MKHIFIQISSFLHLLFLVKKRKVKQPVVKWKLHTIANSELLDYAPQISRELNSTSYPYPKPESELLNQSIEELKMRMTEWQSREHRTKSIFTALKDAREKLLFRIKLFYDRTGFFQTKVPRSRFPLPKPPSHNREQIRNSRRNSAFSAHLCVKKTSLKPQGYFK